MEILLRVTALCVVTALLAVTLRHSAPEMTLLLTLAASLLVLQLLSRQLGDVLDFFRELGERSGISQELLEPLYKTMGIALVVKIGGGLCTDAGEQALASVIELAGTVCALMVALPLLRAVLALLMELL